MSKVYQDNFNNSLSNNSDNEFTKKLRALKKYCPQAYKFVIFRFKDTYLNVENGEYSKEHIKEEIADVMVMLKQFQLYYDIPTEDIKAIMKNKVDRQLERIEYEPKHGKEE